MKRPEIRVFAGPNGSGKSTFTTPEWIVSPYINADDLKRERNLQDLEAAKLATSMREEALSKLQSFTFETVMSKDRNLELLEKAKLVGYFIKGYYIFTRDPLLNCARVEARVAAGGHAVSPEKIVSRYYASVARIPRFLSVCDICHVYDNTNTSSPYRLIRKHKETTSIFPNSIWSEKSIIDLIIRETI